MQDKEELEKLLRDTTAEDYRGKTAFETLSPADKFRWLSQSARFVLDARTSKKKP